MPLKKDHAFTRKMHENLAKLRNDKSFCDVILRSGLREVYAHRIILATLSDYFSLLFKYEGGFEKPAIDFDEDMINGECLENIVAYAYTGEIDICEENVCDLLLASDYFNIQFIKTQCVQLLYELKATTNIINLDNLTFWIWITCHFNLTTFLQPICTFISEHFAETSDILLSVSYHCLQTLLNEKNFTVIYNGIPADDVEFELFHLVVSYIDRYDLSEKSITDLLQSIYLSSIISEQFWSIVESSPCIRNNEAIIRIRNFGELPLFVDGEFDVSANSGGRKYSQGWKYVDGLKVEGDSQIELEDRIQKIKIYEFIGITSNPVCTRTRSRLHGFYSLRQTQVEEHSSIKGLSLAYRSGVTVTMGDISEEAALPFDQVISREFTLAANEVIVKISIEKNHSGMLQTIIFETNLGNVMSSHGAAQSCYYPGYLDTFSPKGECGYLHSLEANSTIDSLKFLWVQYSDPKQRHYEKDLVQQMLQMHILEALLTPRLFPVRDYVDDYYEGFYSGYDDY